MLIFCLLFSGATYILRNKNEANIVLPFYDEPKNTLDVIFIGSSHVMCSVYPMELYDRYGIASYVFASSAQLLPQSYYQLKEALRYQTRNDSARCIGRYILTQNFYCRVRTRSN